MTVPFDGTSLVGHPALSRDRDVANGPFYRAAIVQQPEPALSHRRAEQIAAEMLQARAVRGRHRDVGVEIEAR